jgi:DNA-binding NtrC family response regulator
LLERAMTITPPMSKARILIVDDEPDVLGFMQQLLEQKGYEVDIAAGGAEALILVAERAPALLITDLRMPTMDGIELLGRLREQQRDLPTLVLTAAEDTSTAVRAMRAGAADYLTKPVDLGTLLLSVERALEHQHLQTDAENLRRQLDAKNQEGLDGLLGTSLPMQRIYRMVRQVSPARATVLITGESGTGKGRLARGLSEAARAKIRSHSWPGNVRELENAMERAVVFSEGPIVEPDALPSTPFRGVSAICSCRGPRSPKSSAMRSRRRSRPSAARRVVPPKSSMSASEPFNIDCTSTAAPPTAARTAKTEPRANSAPRSRGTCLAMPPLRA